MGTEVTVGIDIGTSSVKAIAADGDGNVVARSRVPHQVVVPAPERFEHDAAAAWRDGPRRALAELGDLDVRGDARVDTGDVISTNGLLHDHVVAAFARA